MKFESSRQFEFIYRSVISNSGQSGYLKRSDNSASRVVDSSRFRKHSLVQNAGRGRGNGDKSCSCRQWRSREEQHDTTILQGDFYKRLQEDDWRGLFRKTSEVT